MISKQDIQQKTPNVSKGQFLSTLVVVTLLFISGGSMFTTLFAQSQMNYIWTSFTGDMEVLAQAEAKSIEYPRYMENQLEYSTNNAAYELGQNGSDREWKQDSIPEVDSLHEQFLERTFRDSTYGVIANNNFRGCNVPDIGEYDYGRPTLAGPTIGFDFDGSKIRCGYSGNIGTTAMKMPAGSNYQNFNVSNTLNTNNYLQMAEYAVELSHSLNSSLQDGPIYDTATATTSCDPDYDERQEVEAEAEENSAINARDKVHGVADDAVSDTTIPSFLDVDVNEWAANYAPDKVNETESDCSISHTHSNGSCWTANCIEDGEPDHMYSELDEDDECNTEEEVPEDEECVPHTHTTESDFFLEKITYKYNTTLAYYRTSVNLTDSDNEVVTRHGNTNLSFGYTYKDSIE